MFQFDLRRAMTLICLFSLVVWFFIVYSGEDFGQSDYFAETLLIIAGISGVIAFCSPKSKK